MDSRFQFTDNRAHSDANDASSSSSQSVTSPKVTRQTEKVESLIAAEVFDEAGYLRLNPDVQEAVDRGHIDSGYTHYLLHGNLENRALPGMPCEARNVMLASPAKTAQVTYPVRGAVDCLIIAPNAGLMIVGWIDDVNEPIGCIRIVGPNWRTVIDSARFVRVRRQDVESTLDVRAQHLFGFFGFLQFDRGGELAGIISVELWKDDGSSLAIECRPAIVTDVDLRNIALAHLASVSFFGNSSIENKAFLDRGFGTELVRFNRTITSRILSAPYVERFGPQQRPVPRGTIIVCLYGKPEFLFLQNCLFSRLPGIEDYEFVYVSNSPELTETLLREAHSASLTYGLPNTVMVLPGNAGFGGANNVACQVAQSDRLLIVNPDVFPRDPEWAKKHTALLDSVATVRSRLFGVPLYYDDGSLMHGGMYFEVDVGLAMSSGQPVAQRICRVEHYGKGTPPDCAQFTRSRPVPAVTGAFISVERPWFEQLGGFTEDFIFGHYEDADLCLKSIGRGTVPWLHDIRMWHLEGKGSYRERSHEGGSIVNRWLFSRTWMDTIQAGLRGPLPYMLPEPSRPLVASAGESDHFGTAAVTQERLLK